MDIVIQALRYPSTILQSGEAFFNKSRYFNFNFDNKKKLNETTINTNNVIQ